MPPPNKNKATFTKKHSGQVRKREIVRLHSAKGRKLSSSRWLKRQLNDPYSQAVGRLGLRSRAAFKLLELDEKFDLLRHARICIDLGCAPGGWLTIASQRMPPQAVLIGVDLLPLEAVAGAEIITADFLSDSGLEIMRSSLDRASKDGKADLLLSDMAANSSGHYKTDRIRNMLLAEAAADFAFSHLRRGGHFVCKVFGSAQEGSLLGDLKRNFAKTRHFKPPSSRKESAEIYVIAQEFRGMSGE